MNPADYPDLLAKEAEVWNRAAEQMASDHPPEWRHSGARWQPQFRIEEIAALLDRVRPGISALELGCGSGWLTLALAQRGAVAHGIDIADRAIKIARTYVESGQPEVVGRATYQVADLNCLDLPDQAYDLVVANGILHHMMNVERLIVQIDRALKPGGLFWVSDFYRAEAPETVLAASVLTFLLPTRVPYRAKIKGLLRHGIGSPSRVKASMHGEGASPFEGIGREADWPTTVGERFDIEAHIDHPALADYLFAEVDLPEALGRPLLRSLEAADSASVSLKLLRSSGLTLYARKTSIAPSD